MRNPERDFEIDPMLRAARRIEGEASQSIIHELPPEENRKQLWLQKLANFTVEANRNTWAADKGKVDPERPGFKEMEYSRGPWRLRDSYTGYFSAPGMTVVYYKDKPAWTMAYGGKGMEENERSYTKSTFQFLKSALMKITPDFPYRGPKHYQKDSRSYDSSVKGDLVNFIGSEFIRRNGILEFSQVFFGGIVVDKDSSKEPISPWER